jgi:hypothetical protein
MNSMEPKAGEIAHFEINTTNPQRAKNFYSSVFGDGITPGGGINPLTEPSQTKAPTVYFATDNIEGLVRRVHGPGRKLVLAVPDDPRDDGADGRVPRSTRIRRDRAARATASKGRLTYRHPTLML